MMFSEFFTKTTDTGNIRKDAFKKKSRKKTRRKSRKSNIRRKMKSSDKVFNLREMNKFDRDCSRSKIFERLRNGMEFKRPKHLKIKESGDSRRIHEESKRRIRSSDKALRQIPRIVRQFGGLKLKSCNQEPGQNEGRRGARKTARRGEGQKGAVVDNEVHFFSRFERNKSQGNINYVNKEVLETGSNANRKIRERFSSNNLSFRTSQLSESKKENCSLERRKAKPEKNPEKKKVDIQRKIDVEFVKSVKHNRIEKCLDFISPDAEVKANLNAKFENDWTALHFACWKENFKIVNLLIFNGADVNSFARNDLTPLMVACSVGNEKIIRVLLNAGAIPQNKDGGGNTALHYVAKSGNVAAIKVIIDVASVNLKAKNNIGMTPYDLAPNKESKEFLLKTENLKEKKERESLIRIHKYRKENFATLRGERKLELSHQDSKSSTSRSDCDTESCNSDSEKLGPQNFMVHSLIGRGAFGEVYLVERKDTGVFYAMKVLDKDKIIRHNLVGYAKTERNVLSIMNHPFIVRLNNAFQTGKKLFLILDYCPGGDLANLIRKKRRFSEKMSKLYLSEIVLALESLHKRDIIFRDLKPDNIVIDSEGHVLLTDFGLSKEGVLNNARGAQSFCGSVAYLAPEMLKKRGHGKAVDWYLLGVLFYEMLVGVPPYFANTQEEIFSNIARAPLKIPSQLSKEAKLLLKQLLQRNPDKRLGSKNDYEDIKNHPFFKEVNWGKVFRREIKPPKPEIKLLVPEFVSSQMFYESGTGHSGAKVEGWSFINNQVYRNHKKT